MTTIRDERSIAQLFGDSISELTKLVQNEFDLARAEIVQKLSLGTAAAKLIVGGAVFLTPGIVLVLLAIAAELTALGLSQPLANLVSGVEPRSSRAFWWGLGCRACRRVRSSQPRPSIRSDRTRRWPRS